MTHILATLPVDSNSAEYHAPSGPAAVDSALFARFQYMAELSADWYWEQDEQFRFRHAYKVRGHTGFTSDSYLGKCRWEVPGVREGAAFWATHREVLEAHQPFRDLEFSATTEQGEVIWVTISGDPVFDSEGHFCGYRGIGRNITRQKQVEAALQEREERLKFALVAAQEGLWDWNIDTDEVFYSERWKQMLGYSENEIEPHVNAWKRLLHSDDQATVHASLQRILAKDENYELEFRLRHKNGHYVDILSRGLPIRSSPGGRITRIVGTHLDVTERKRIEGSLHELANFNAGVLNAISAQICVLDAEGTILATNAAWRKLAESESQNLTRRVEGANYFQICAGVTGSDADTAKAASTGIALVASGQSAEFQLDYPCPSGGETRWYQLRATRIQGRGLPRVVVAHYDITPRIRGQSALRVALHEKEMLLREMHHRVKNNLQVISGLLHFQSKRVRRDEDKAVFEQGQAHLRSMILLHESLYEASILSSVEFGGYLRSLVQELVNSHGRLTERVVCEVHAEELNLPIQIAMPCGMLLNELLSNAFKHAFPGERQGRIEVNARQDGNTLLISVKDDGVGNETNVGVATGFGLRLVEKLADQMNAKMILQYNRGVNVEVRVPLNAPILNSTLL